jgi:hypothetical protein
VVIYDSTGAIYGGGGEFLNQVTPNFKSDLYTITTADSIKGYVKIPVNFTIPAGGYYVGFELYSTGGAYTVRLAQDESVEQDSKASLIYLRSNGLYTNPNAIMLRLNENTSNDPCNSVNILISGTVNQSSSSTPYATITNVNSTGGVAPYTFYWKGPNNYTSTDSVLLDILVVGDYTVVSTDKNGCTGTSVFNITTSVFENTANQSINIFPNPSKGKFTLNSENANGEFTITVQNLIGQTILSETVNAKGKLNAELDLTSVEKGVYFINISSDSFEFTEKVIIK